MMVAGAAGSAGSAGDRSGASQPVSFAVFPFSASFFFLFFSFRSGLRGSEETTQRRGAIRTLPLAMGGRGRF